MLMNRFVTIGLFLLIINPFQSTTASTLRKRHTTTDSEPLLHLKEQCPNSDSIDNIVTSTTTTNDDNKNENKFFTHLDAGMVRFQTLCVQFDVDLFALATAVASGGTTAVPGTENILPFSTTISFALNLQVKYGSCASDGTKCPLSITAEGSIGVGLAVKLGNLAQTHFTAFLSGSFTISSEDAQVCDPAKHGGASYISPISFNCGAGWLLGTWFTQFFQHRLSSDPKFQVAAYHDLITDVTRLEVEQGIAEEQEAVSALLNDMRSSRRLFKEDIKKRKESTTALAMNDKIMLSKHPLYKKGALFNYLHNMNSAPLFWAESQLGEVELQRVFENQHVEEYQVAEWQATDTCQGTINARCKMRTMLMDESPFIQHTGKHVIKWREHIGLYPDPSLPAYYFLNRPPNNAGSTLPYTGQPVYDYLTTGSDRLRRIYEKNKNMAPTIRAYAFYKSKRSGCNWKDEQDVDHCYIRHPGVPLTAKNWYGNNNNNRIVWSSKNGIFNTATNIRTLRRMFVWYIRWLLEIRILSSYFWPSKESAAGKNKRNTPTRLDSCAALPVSFEDIVSHSDKNGAGMQLAREWGVVSCPNGPIGPWSGPNWRERRRSECENDFKYVWSARYFCYVGKHLSDIPIDKSECKDPLSRKCIYLDRPQFSRTEGETQRPFDRYLFTTGKDRPSEAGQPNDPYPKSGHDELFPDEYAIPLWSANVFPYVTRAAVETMRKLRYCADKTKGIEIINTFRSQLSSQVRSVDVDETGIEAIDVDEDDQEEVEDEDVQDGDVEDEKEAAADRITVGCIGEPLCITETFEKFWRVEGKTIADHIGLHNTKSVLTFAERAALIMPGLGYQIQAGYVHKIHGNLKAAGDAVSKQIKSLKLKSKITYVAGVTFGVSIGTSQIGFCTPDTNTFQVNLPQFFWSGSFEPGQLDSRITFSNPDSWAADFFLFFPGIPVNLHVKRIGKIGVGPFTPFSYTLEIKVRVKNHHPIGSFNMNGIDGASWTAPTESIAGISGIPSFVASALPTFLENLIPALIQIIYYTGDVLKNKKMTATKGLQLLQKALGSLLKPHGALLALGLGWFMPESGPYNSASVNALILRATIEPGQKVKFGMTYAYTSIKELTLNVLPGLTIKPAMLFGFRWDIGNWLNKNVLVKFTPKDVLDSTSQVDLFPNSNFRTERCNTCIGIFDKVIRGGAYISYCDTNTRAHELCAQVETSVKTFLESNGSPGIWRHWFGGLNKATKQSFKSMFGWDGTMKEVREEFADRCKQWPTEQGKNECLAQEFCLYSGVACHAKIQTEAEEAMEAASRLKLDIEDVGLLENPTDSGEDEVNPMDLIDPVYDPKNVIIPEKPSDKPVEPRSHPSIEKKKQEAIPPMIDILNGKDDKLKRYLKLSASKAINLNPTRWSEWLRANKRGIKRKQKKVLLMHGMIKNTV